MVTDISTRLESENKSVSFKRPDPRTPWSAWFSEETLEAELCVPRPVLASPAPVLDAVSGAAPGLGGPGVPIIFNAMKQRSTLSNFAQL